MILLLLSFKCKKLTRVFFFLELLIVNAHSFRYIDVGSAGFFFMNRSLFYGVVFLANFFHFWLSYAGVILTMALAHLNRYLIYRDEIELVITHFLVGFIWMTLYMSMIQLWFNKIGMTFTEQILDSGSTQILDNLDEGVIILDEGKKN